MKPKTKSTKEELTRRTLIVEELLYQGLQPYQIHKYISEIDKHLSNEQNWNITTRTIDNYIQYARKNMNKRKEIEVEYERNKAKRLFERIITKAEQSNDFSSALQAQSKLIEFIGIGNTKNINIKTEGFRIIIEKDEDVKKPEN